MSARLDVDVRLKRGAFALAARFTAPLDGVTAVFGPSGAGKSLLLSALGGFQRLDAGRIALGARVLDDVAAGVRTPPHLRGVGTVFQDARLFPHLTVRGNLDYAARRAPVGAAALDEIAAQFELLELIDRPVRNLSGGERNRVALARALLAAPDLLLLDEPFAALDGVRRIAFLERLRVIHETAGLPMIVVTHQIDDAAALADEIVAVRNGAVVAAGPLRETALEPDVQALLARRDAGASIAASAFLAPGAPRGGHVWVRADHVLLASEEPRGLSARNIWQGRVAAIVAEDGGAHLVRVETAVGALMSRVTRQAVEELRLAPGAQAWAIVKAHAV